MENEIFEVSTRSARDIAGVFEYDGDVGYFYLYDLSKEKGKQIKGSLYVNSENPDFKGTDVSVRWNISEEIVGLYIHGRLWAAFDLKGQKFGGHYKPGKLPNVPEQIVVAFRNCGDAN